MKNRFIKGKILTVPNLISALRLLLIPFIVWQYLYMNKLAAVILLAVSGISDIADGKIARKYNAVSDFGKILDPAADKLTQAALIICLISKYKMMYAVIILFAVREIILAFLGVTAIRLKDTVNSAKWYGKLSTAYMYAVMLILIVFDGIPHRAADAMLLGGCGVIVLSFILYGRFYFSLLREELLAMKENKTLKLALRILLICLWAVIIAVCYVNRKKISIDGIIGITPANMSLAIVLMLILFTLKSITVVIYCGILYIACGIIFPLPVAIAVNIAGTAIMVTIPYYIGRFTGSETVRNIAHKHPKIAEIQEMRRQNDFFLAFLVRIIGLLPSDPISAYMGAIGLQYKKYVAGTLLGMLPSMIAFPIIGMSITDPASPTFIAAVTFEISVTVISVTVYSVIKRKKNKT